MRRICISETSMMVVHPPETSFDAAVHDKVTEIEERGGVFNAYDEEQDAWLGHLIELAEEIAEEQRVFLDVHTHQLTATTPEAGVKSRRILERQDVVVTANSSDTVCAFIVAALRTNPVMRCIMSFNNGGDLERRLEVLRSVRTPVFSNKASENHPHTMPRILAVVRKDEKRLRAALWQCMDIRNTQLLGAYSPSELYVGES